MSLSGMFPIENSALYIFFIEEKEHIEKNKWYLSQKRGYEVSKHEATWDWAIHYREKWISGLRESGRYPV